MRPLPPYYEPMPNYARTRRLLLILAAVLLVAVLRSAAYGEPILDCLGDVSDLERVTVQVHARNRPMTSAQLESLAAVDGESIWIGYENGAWDYPPGFKEMTFTRYWVFGKRDGAWVWVMLYIGAEWSYGFTFANTEVYADANGEHVGQHPCAAYALDGRDVLAAMAE